MKRAEIFLGAFALIALSFDLLLIRGGGLLTIISLSSLSVLYMFFSFSIFNEIRLRHIFKKGSYQGIRPMRVIGAILTGLALSVTINGLLFRFMTWPGASIILVGLSGLAFALIVGAMQYSMTKTKPEYYTKIFKRIAVYSGLGLILIILPPDTWLELRYRNHPDYIESVKKAMYNPENQELWDKVDEERNKMYEEK